jgi:hypothetical protein
METLHAMKPDKFGGIRRKKRCCRRSRKRKPGVKLTPAEHDLVLKIEKKLGQKLLIDPNTPRDVKQADFFLGKRPRD